MMEIGNLKFFHASLKIKKSRSTISMIEDQNSCSQTTPDGIDVVFLDYYISLLRSNYPSQFSIDFLSSLPMPQLNSNHQDTLTSIVSNDEIRNTIIRIRKEAYGRPDGFSARFYTHFWHIIHKDVLLAMHNFFSKENYLSPLTPQI